ncbi:glycosyltransferase family 4 protein [Oceanibium sediminis]|uniref:glycosyltransferase family 4 protein n=1 Tax=Oceanibium sediminis TaxID=2026339 RepID=UPI000DD4C72D|nr:glycosyltransferase family 4 protein [Oceanibium sediminis]
MKILFTHRYFWPDTAPYAALMRRLAEEMAEAGHEVSVFASRPSYRGGGSAPRRERLGALDVTRIWVLAENRRNPAARMFNVLIYCLGLVWHILRTRPDVVTASTFPPVMAAWSASVAARLCGAQFVYHMQDIHPEVSEISGGLLGRQPLAGLLRWLDNQSLRRAAAIVVLSEDMADTLQARMARKLPIHVINNFQLPSFEDDIPPPRDLAKPKGITRIIFAGNLGRFQNLPRLVEGVLGACPPGAPREVLLLGDGAAVPELRQRFGDHPNLRFAPFLPYAQARVLIAEADVGLVSLTPGIYRVAYPSKMLTYLGLGVPVLALVEAQSALARTLHDAALGKVPASDAPDAIAAALEELLLAPPSTEALREWYTGEAAQAPVMARWRGLFADLASTDPA